MSAAGVEVLERFVALLRQPDTVGQAMVLVSPNFVGVEPPSLPYGGVYHGSDDLMRMIWGVNNVLRIAVKDIVVRDAEDRVMAEVHVALTSMEHGTVLHTQVIELYSVVDGQITGMEVFCQDTKAVHDLLSGATIPGGSDSAIEQVCHPCQTTSAGLHVRSAPEISLSPAWRSWTPENSAAPGAARLLARCACRSLA